MDRQAFIGTGVVSAAIVDAARLLVYGWSFYAAQFGQVSRIWGRVVAAFLGAFIGARSIKKVTLAAVQNIVAAMLFVVGIRMAAGLI